MVIKSVTLSIVGKEGFKETVTLSVTKPTGFTVQIPDTTVNAGSSTNIRITVSPSVATGFYQVIFKGKRVQPRYKKR